MNQNQENFMSQHASHPGIKELPDIDTVMGLTSFFVEQTDLDCKGISFIYTLKL